MNVRKILITSRDIWTFEAMDGNKIRPGAVCFFVSKDSKSGEFNNKKKSTSE